MLKSNLLLQKYTNAKGVFYLLAAFIWGDNFHNLIIKLSILPGKVYPLNYRHPL